jgi:hypothetical protein
MNTRSKTIATKGVRSKLDTSVFYEESRTLFPEDKTVSLTFADLSIKDVDVDIAIGKEKYTFIDKNIIYFPIYLVFNEKFKDRIGVYEFSSEQLYSLVNPVDDDDEETDELNLEHFKSPLLFSFVTTEYLSKYGNKSDESDEEDSDDKVGHDTKDIEKEIEMLDSDSDDDDDESDESDDDSSDDSDEKEDDGADEESGDIEDAEGDIEEPERGIDMDKLKIKLEHIITHDTEEPLSLELLVESILNKEESVEKYKRQYNQYKSRNRSFRPNWVQSLFKNLHYGVTDNEGGGDCFFAMIRDALEYLGLSISVFELRTLFANEIDETVFTQYKSLYMESKANMNETKTTRTQLRRELKELQSQLKLSTSSSEREILKGSIEDKTNMFNVYTDMLQSQHEMYQEYSFMKSIDSLEQMRSVVKTCEFWADTITISTLERILNLKVIILSEGDYMTYKRDGQEHSYKKIFQCGMLNDNILEERGTFTPKYYIIADWTGDHYKLITYKKRGIFTFEQLPYQVKKNISERCIRVSHPVGPYAIIPKFMNFRIALQTLE